VDAAVVNEAEYFREQANECRSAAATCRDHEVKHQLLQLARHYDKEVKAAEDISAGLFAGHKRNA
jgi:hypothetical protein